MIISFQSSLVFTKLLVSKHRQNSLQDRPKERRRLLHLGGDVVSFQSEVAQGVDSEDILFVDVGGETDLSLPKLKKPFLGLKAVSFYRTVL